MSRDLYQNSRLAGRGQKFPVDVAAFDSDTLAQGTEVTVWSKQVPQDKTAWFGAGPSVRDYAEAFIFLELVASGNGSANSGDVIEGGELVAAVTDSEQKRVLASTTVDSLGELADAKADQRTDRPIMASLAPYATPGRHLEFRIVANTSSDGVEIDPAASSGRLYYSQA